jgi:hypothetical protein
MTTDRKKPGAAFWATVVVVTLVGYVLSIGVLGAMFDRGALHPGTFIFEICVVYSWPARFVYQHGPEWLRECLRWYYGLF